MGMTEQLQEAGWTVTDVEPLPGDDQRVMMGYTLFKRLEPPEGISALFPLGQVVITPGACTALSMSTPDGQFNAVLAADMLEKFVQGDWGDSPPERAAENNAVLGVDGGGGGRIAACYPAGYGMAVWLVSEWDRSLTSFVGAGEYR